MSKAKQEIMPNGINPEEFLDSARRRTTLAILMGLLGFIASVILVGFLSTYGVVGTLWGLWIIIFWMNIALVVLAYGAEAQRTAVFLGWRWRGTRDESQLVEEVLRRLDEIEKARSIESRMKDR
jgi:MFS family permease